MLSKQIRELIHSYFDKTMHDNIHPFSFLLRFFFFFNQTRYLYDNWDVTSCNLTIVSRDNYVPFFTTLGLDSVNFFKPEAHMWTLPDHLGASRKCSPTPALPGVRQNLPDVKIQKKKKNFFFF